MGYVLEGSTGAWEVVVGLEVHAQVISESKLFSGASATYGGAPNTHVSFIDAGFPGMLPVINRECVAQAVRTGLGLNAQINLLSRFDRKNYFYADLPNGYQISQFAQPIVGAGVVEIELPDGTVKEIGITRLHLEQDAGKSMHDQHPAKSVIDLNRAGVGLMEIVSEPDLRSPEEAGAYVRKLRQILRYLGTCDGNMEEGSMRADVNVSVRRPGEDGFRTRCGSSCTRWRRRRSGRSRCGKAAARLSRRPGCTTRRGARRGPCGPRRTRMTTGIFRSRICSRWCWRRRGWRS
jgi:aspartyl-tRNA(Asn)/glutamyl-tRNA(Gln) amidotransferase subunit B